MSPPIIVVSYPCACLQHVLGKFDLNPPSVQVAKKYVPSVSTTIAFF